MENWVLFDKGNSREAFLQLDDFIYPIENMEAFKAVKTIVGNKREMPIDNSEINEYKKGQHIR